ncbi:hydantoinase/carbamoylase family amidase [Bradyrhizobium elkanii]
MSRAATNLQIDSARLWGTIHETAQFGATLKGGVRRLTLSAEDKQVRDWFRKACEDAGLEVQVDALGSMFGLRKGRDMSKPPIGVGSHLDTQPTGGKYDGVLGTLAALEMVRTLNDAGIETELPICICNWTNEEGSRFAPAMMASAAYVGDFTTDDILSRKDAEGVTVAQALDTIGYRGDAPVGRQKFTSFVELHIEQGPILEAENKTIGVVDSGQGVLWYDGKITGFESHAGSTPDAAAPRCAGDAVRDRAGDGEHREEARPEGSRHHRRGRDRRALAQRHPRRDRLHGGLPQRRRRDHGCAGSRPACRRERDRSKAQGRGAA